MRMFCVSLFFCIYRDVAAISLLSVRVYVEHFEGWGMFQGFALWAGFFGNSFSGR